MIKKISLLAIIAAALVVPTTSVLAARYSYSHTNYNSNTYRYASRYSRPQYVSQIPAYVLPNYAPYDMVGALMQENASYVSQARWANILYPPRYGYGWGY